MSLCWYFYRFDYARYVALRPSLRAATTPDALARLGTSPDVNVALEALAAEEIDLREAKNVLTQSLCCAGDPLPFDQGFPRFVASLAHTRDTEDAAELLRAMLGGGKNLEAFLYPAPGLLGFLTPAETALLSRAYPLLQHRVRQLRGKRRRGGIVGACSQFVRRLFDRGALPEDVLRLLGELVEQAVEAEEGIAVVVG